MYLKNSATYLLESANTTTIRDELIELRSLMNLVNDIEDGLWSLWFGGPLPGHLN